MAASLIAGTTIASTLHAATASAAPAAPASPGQPSGTMTLDEFLAKEGPAGGDGLLARLDCHTFSACHQRMHEEHGVWIPELVPVFAKLDAMRAGGTASR